MALSHHTAWSRHFSSGQPGRTVTSAWHSSSRWATEAISSAVSAATTFTSPPAGFDWGGHGGSVDSHVTNVTDANTEEGKALLKVIDVDFHITENAQKHHTSEYELTRVHQDVDNKTVEPRLVVRRGEPFDITITFDRIYNKAKDDIKLVFDVENAPSPRENRGTRVTLMLSAEDKPKEWGAKIVKQAGKKATIRIFTPATIVIGKWLFKFDTVVKSGDTPKTFRYTHPTPFYMICNPWCSDDLVYLDDVESRKEHVLNDRGRIYRGNKKQISAKPWNFGQFEDFVLECAIFLLDESLLSYRKRGDPIQLVRKISALVNSADDNGILTGNWSGDYSGGTSPLFWVGSVKILEQFWKTKEPVRYGQCWVFSGVTTTLCRTLGIPCRSVTNFASAHDTDGSITIDTHWATGGEPLENLNDDSVWNFHVWNDVWMARPDLPSGFGGWQAIDATPQEASEGVYCCGPTSVEALKNGLVNLLYDSPFVFAEVNADRVNWIQKADGTWANTKQTSAVGKNMSTKSVGNNNRLDVTGCYKFPEGSKQERTAVWRAIKEGESDKKDIYEATATDMEFDLIEKEDALFGEPFDVKIMITNKSTKDRVVTVALTATAVFYTGVPVNVIKTETYQVQCPVSAAGEVGMSVTVDDYMDKLVDMCNIKISCMAQVEETRQYYCESDDFRLLKPDLVVKAPEEVRVGQEYAVEVSFTNPLPRALTKCEFQIEGASLQRPLALAHDNVPPKGVAKVSARLRAAVVGEKEIIGSFDSKELSDVSGSANVTVRAV